MVDGNGSNQKRGTDAARRTTIRVTTANQQIKSGNLAISAVLMASNSNAPVVDRNACADAVFNYVIMDAMIVIAIAVVVDAADRNGDDDDDDDNSDDFIFTQNNNNGDTQTNRMMGKSLRLLL